MPDRFIGDDFTRLLLGGRAHRRSLGSPGFPVKSCGFGQLHVVLFKENHISGRCESGGVGNPGTLGMTTRRESLRGEDCCQGPGRPFVRNQKKSQALRMTALWGLKYIWLDTQKHEKIEKVTGSQAVSAAPAASF